MKQKIKNKNKRNSGYLLRKKANPLDFSAISRASVACGNTAFRGRIDESDPV
jgi:hypothetical protein